MDQNDWRLGGQDRYLKGVTLLRRAYTRYREGWDHDHCAFCWTKFMVEDGPGVLHEGYCTEDGYHWVCGTCFADFRAAFEWRVRGGGGEHALGAGGGGACGPSAPRWPDARVHGGP